MDFYNEWDEDAATWLRNLSHAGMIPHGTVDTRSIADLSAADVIGFRQVHFFAGIGGWAEALRLARWPEDRPVWTGSCPCQPFSIAGKRAGEADARHLWPEFCRLIAECRPSTIFGEQVASHDGREWLSRVRVNLEALGYAVGCADLCAAGVGAPHMRQRLYWVAHSNSLRLQCARAAKSMAGPASEIEAERYQWKRGGCSVWDSGARSSRLADADNKGLERPEGERSDTRAQRTSIERDSFWGDAEWLEGADGKSRRVKPGVPLLVDGLPRDVAAALSGFGNAIPPQAAATFIGAFLECG